jgi:hypothetical protein
VLFAKPYKRLKNKKSLRQKDVLARAGHFRDLYRSSDIRYLSDTEKRIEISDLKVPEDRISGHQISTFDSPILSDTEKNIGTKKQKKWHCIIDISQYRLLFGFFLLYTDRVPFELLDSATLL